MLNLEKADEDELYEALDWLISKQEKIENKLASLHLNNGSLVLYDVTSTYLEGNECELGKYGYNRDKKKGKTQIVFGLLCDQNGCPIAVEVFEGNTSDTSTFLSQIEKVRKRFGVKNVVWVTDRGILTSSNIKELVKPVECTLESGKYVFDKITRPTSLQQKAIEMLGISSICTQ
ncbi:MAG: IS1634 family transposase [Crocosphaera sp.]|nr:IS1634 family transposase [Crocosphaera sp.]